MAGDRLRRLLRLSLLFQARANLDAVKLSRLLEVSKRTILRDIRVLQEAGLDVAFDPAAKAYVLQSQLLKPTSRSQPDGDDPAFDQP